MSDLLLERSAELAAIDRALRGRARRPCSAAHDLRAAGQRPDRAARIRARTRRAHGLTVLAAAGEPASSGFPFALARRLLEPDEVASTDRYGLQLELNRVLAGEDAGADRDRRPAVVRPRFAALAGVRGAAAAPDGARAGRGLGQRDDRIPRRDGAAAAAVSAARGRDAPARRARARGRRPLRRRLPSRDRRPAAAGARARRRGAPEPRARDGRRRAVGRVGGPARRRALPRSAPGRRCRRRPARSRARLRCSTPRPPRTRRPRSPDWGPTRRRPPRTACSTPGCSEGTDDRAAAARARALRRAIPPARRARMHAQAARFGGAEPPPAAQRAVARTRGSWTCCGRAAEQALEQGPPGARGRAPAPRRPRGRRGRAAAADARARARGAATRRARREIGDLEAAVEHGAPRVAVDGRARAGAAGARARAGGAGARTRRRRRAARRCPRCCRARARSAIRAPGRAPRGTAGAAGVPGGRGRLRGVQRRDRRGAGPPSARERAATTPWSSRTRAAPRPADEVRWARSRVARVLPRLRDARLVGPAVARP